VSGEGGGGQKPAHICVCSHTHAHTATPTYAVSGTTTDARILRHCAVSLASIDMTWAIVSWGTTTSRRSTDTVLMQNFSMGSAVRHAYSLDTSGRRFNVSSKVKPGKGGTGEWGGGMGKRGRGEGEGEGGKVERHVMRGVGRRGRARCVGWIFWCAMGWGGGGRVASRLMAGLNCHHPPRARLKNDHACIPHWSAEGGAPSHTKPSRLERGWWEWARASNAGKGNTEGGAAFAECRYSASGSGRKTARRNGRKAWQQ
jgi:hypothetical protein